MGVRTYEHNGRSYKVEHRASADELVITDEVGDSERVGIRIDGHLTTYVNLFTIIGHATVEEAVGAACERLGSRAEQLANARKEMAEFHSGLK